MCMQAIRDPWTVEERVVDDELGQLADLDYRVG